MADAVEVTLCVNWDGAHAAVFLASDESSYINGTTLVVDGGLSATMSI